MISFEPEGEFATYGEQADHWCQFDWPKLVAGRIDEKLDEFNALITTPPIFERAEEFKYLRKPNSQFFKEIGNV